MSKFKCGVHVSCYSRIIRTVLYECIKFHKLYCLIRANNSYSYTHTILYVMYILYRISISIKILFILNLCSIFFI